MTLSLFSQFSPVLRAFGDRQTLDGLVLRELTLGVDGPVSCVYAPFDHTPASARLAIVGIAPGRVQAENALRAAGAALRAGKPAPEAARIAKLTGSFSGAQTRANLVAMLDAIGLATLFGLKTCADLFDPSRELVHFTSALRYPVFVNGANYNGTPNMVRTKFLLRMIETHLAAEAVALPDTLWLPLGPKPAAALQHLIRLGALPAARVLDGMPHPSGLNGERIAAFLGRLDPARASVKTNVAKLMLARVGLADRVSSLSA
jgi:hypothetical protein